VRQQAGFFEHAVGHGVQVVQRARMPEVGERPARLGPAALGLIPEREERLVATGGLPGAGDGQHLVGAEIGGMPWRGPLRERAVVALVAAQPRQRDEDLARERDDLAAAVITHGRGGGHQRRQIVDLGQRQGLLVAGLRAGHGALGQRLQHLGGRCGGPMESHGVRLLLM
jgi:hypothetical protein